MGETNIDVRDYNELNRAISLAQHTVYKRYLDELDICPLIKPTKILMDEKAADCVRLFRLEKLSCKKGEDVLQKLSTVYYAAMSLGCSLIVMLDVESNDAPVKIYIGVRNDGMDNSRLGTSFTTLKNGFLSNFPGTSYQDISFDDIPEITQEIFGENVKCVSSVSCVASSRDKSKTENKSFVQGIERFIDAMRGKTYTALFIAEPVSTSEQMEIRSGYEDLYSALSSFSKSVWSYNENESNAVMESLSKGISKAVTDGTSHTQAHTVSVGANLGFSASQNSSTSESKTKTSPTKVARAGQAIGEAGELLELIGPLVTPACAPLGAVITVAGIAAPVVAGLMQGSSVAETITETVGKSLGVNGGISAGYARTMAESQTHAESNSTNESVNSGTSTTEGEGTTLQIENVNKSVEQMLQNIENQLTRTKELEDYGAYSCGAYFLSARKENCLLAANTYRSLMIGEGSSVESGAVNFWGIQGDEQDTEEKVSVAKEKVKTIKEYLKRFTHPIFAMTVSETIEDISDFVTYTPGTIVSGLELPLHLGVPMKSVYGLSVIEHAEFGRNVISTKQNKVSEKIQIGKIYHMGQVENADVSLDVSSLCSHTFITGSTGTGKSNTVYQILAEVKNKGVKFLVIEPAKGEYKNVFGGCEDVEVYGTNPNKATLLRLNPFSFPEDIHVLEHIDRLVEIFNACWPMYAAMPAVLKDAIEQAYIKRGWDMASSICNCNPGVFPTFADVMEVLPNIINESAFSSDTKGDYIGALGTRLKSMTNGINGQIFCSAEELSNEKLFDENVVIDISRVGSSETKSLLMGILVLKLQEYRMSEAQRDNEKLRHVTVLEEAHHLLRRTSTAQTQESSNLQGKSVEMIANAIAEMRTYGEGFIIADQAPGLMDESVIRNTNTKIILRLPSEEDRQLVGRAAALNDFQIAELSKLSQGVAVVYQNDWLEAVLCKVELYSESRKAPYDYNGPKTSTYLPSYFQIIFGLSDDEELTEEQVDQIRKWIDRHNMSPRLKRILNRHLTGEKLSDDERENVAYNLFHGKRYAQKLENAKDEATAIEDMRKELERTYYLNEDLSVSISEILLRAILDKKQSLNFLTVMRDTLSKGA